MSNQEPGNTSPFRGTQANEEDAVDGGNESKGNPHRNRLTRNRHALILSGILFTGFAGAVGTVFWMNDAANGNVKRAIAADAEESLTGDGAPYEEAGYIIANVPVFNSGRNPVNEIKILLDTDGNGTPDDGCTALYQGANYDILGTAHFTERVGQWDCASLGSVAVVNGSD